MPGGKQSSPEALMIRLARVAGSVVGTLAAKTAKVVGGTRSSPQEGGPKSPESSATRAKQARSRGKKKAKRVGQRQKRKRNRSRAA